MRKQEVDVQLAKWIVSKLKQPRPGHLLLLSLLGQVIAGMRKDTNRCGGIAPIIWKINILTVTTYI